MTWQNAKHQHFLSEFVCMCVAHGHLVFRLTHFRDFPAHTHTYWRGRPANFLSYLLLFLVFHTVVTKHRCNYAEAKWRGVRKWELTHKVLLPIGHDLKNKTKNAMARRPKSCNKQYASLRERRQWASDVALLIFIFLAYRRNVHNSRSEATAKRHCPKHQS